MKHVIFTLEILRSGKINDPEWWYVAIKTAGKGPEPAQGVI
jgi:hypothetical protein